MQVRITAKSTPNEILQKLLEKTTLVESEGKDFKADEAIICLQQEYVLYHPGDIKQQAVENKSESKSTIKYIGTKNVDSCIFVYIYSPEDAFAIHCDCYTKPLDFLPLIQKFRNKKELGAIIIGSNSKSTISFKIIEYVFSELIKIAADFKIEIPISGCLLAQNDARESDKAHFIFDKLIEKAKVLHRCLYGQGLDIDSLDISVKDFKKVSESNDYTFLKLLHSVEVFHTPASLEFLSRFPDLASDNSLFYAYLKDAISLKGFMLFNQLYLMNNKFNDTHFNHFVIDILSKQIKKIPYHTFTHSEVLRAVKLLDILNTQYRPCFEEGQYKIPTLSKKLQDKIAKFVTCDPIRKLDKEQIYAFIRYDSGKYFCDPSRANIIGRDLLAYLQDCHENIVFTVPPANHQAARELQKMLDPKDFSLQENKKHNRVNAYCSLRWLNLLSEKRRQELARGGVEEIDDVNINDIVSKGIHAKPAAKKTVNTSGIGFPLLK